MLQEHQSYSSGKFCECGAELILCEDWPDNGKWINGDPECLHEQDEDEQIVDLFVDRLVDSIRQQTKKIADIDTMPVRMHQGEDDSHVSCDR
jgi:hypothetical protein